MKNRNINIKPVGLKGKEINERMRELMGMQPINENQSSIVVELTKVGPDGKAYAIVRENHEYYIKTTDKTSKLMAEDFSYIGGLMNKKSEAYPSYAKAIKHLNLKFKSLAEAHDFEGEINVFQNDNLLNEDVASFSNFGGNGFSGSGNLEGNSALYEEEVDEAEEDRFDTVTGEKLPPLPKDAPDPITEDEDEDDLTEAEKAIDAMLETELTGDQEDLDVEPEGGDDDIDSKDLSKLRNDKDKVNEGRFTILNAIKEMDSIIDALTEGKVKKKV